MDSILTQLGVGGILVVLVLREVLPYVRGKNNKGFVDKQCVECFRLIRELHTMHNQKDNDGVYVWYVRRSLEEAIVKLGENIEHQTTVFRELALRIKERIK